MSATRDVLLVLAGAGGTALTGVITAVVRARIERRAARRARVAAQIDEHLALYGDYLMAVDDLASALVIQIDDEIVAPPLPVSDEHHAQTQRARQEHERIYHRVALVAPDDVAEAFLAVHDALADFYAWAMGQDLTEEESERHQGLVTQRAQDFVNELRAAYWKYEESL